MKVGQGFELEPVQACNKNMIGEINYKKLPASTVLKRIRFIKEKLQLDNNEMIKDRPDIKSKLIKVALDHFDIFSVDDTDIGNCDLFKYDIELTEDAKPCKSKNMSLNPEYEDRLKEQLEIWLASGIVSEGLSEWNSPIFAVLFVRRNVMWLKLIIQATRESWPV